MKKKTVHIVLDSGLINLLDTQAKAESLSRSALLRKIGRTFLKGQPPRLAADDPKSSCRTSSNIALSE